MEIVKLINGLGEIFYAIRVCRETIEIRLFLPDRKTIVFDYLSLHDNYLWSNDEHVLKYAASKDLQLVQKRFDDNKDSHLKNKIVKVIQRKCKCECGK